jgi:hypothetical protein
MAQADKGPYGKEAAQLAAELRAYRLRRWGKTDLEVAIEGATSVGVKELLKRSEK